MGEFDIRTKGFSQGGFLLNAHYAEKGVVIEADSRNPLDRSDTVIPAGTPIALISGGSKYKPVRRGVVASATYDSAADETTITFDNSVECFAVGDTVQVYTGADGAVTDLGAITAVSDADNQIVVAGDHSGDISADDLIDVTETGQGQTVLFLLEGVDVFPSGVSAAQDVTCTAIIHGFVYADGINAVEGADVQLQADVASQIYIET